MSWTTGDILVDEVQARTVTISVSGESYEIPETANFVDTVKEYAQEAGLRNFRVLVDGRNVEPSEAPRTFEGIRNVTIVPYDKAG